MLMKHTYNEDGFEGEVRFYRSALTGRRLCFGAGTYSVHQQESQFYILVHDAMTRYYVTTARPECVEQVPPPRVRMFHVRTIEPETPKWFTLHNDEPEET